MSIWLGPFDRNRFRQLVYIQVIQYSNQHLLKFETFFRTSNLQTICEQCFCHSERVWDEYCQRFLTEAFQVKCLSNIANKNTSSQHLIGFVAERYKSDFRKESLLLIYLVKTFCENEISPHDSKYFTWQYKAVILMWNTNQSDWLKRLFLPKYLLDT